MAGRGGDERMSRSFLGEGAVRLELTLALTGKTAAAFGAIGFASLSPFVRDEFSLSGFGVGGIMGLVFVGAIIATVPGGRLTDRVSAGRMLGATLLLQAAALGLVAGAPSVAVFYLAIALNGFAMGAGDPATNVLVSANVPRRRRGLVMGIKQTGFAVGGLLGGLVLPSVAEAAGWRVAVVVPIATCAAVGLLGYWAGGVGAASPQKVATEPIRAASLLGMGSYGFFMAGVQLSVVGLMAIYLIDQHALSATTAGLAIAVTLAGGMIGRIVWGVISDRLVQSRFATLQLAAVGAGAALAVLSVVGAQPVLWPVLFVLGFCALGWNTVYVTVAAESVPATSVGRATGAVLFFSYAGALLVPPLLGMLVDGTDSWAMTWLVAAAVVGAGLVAFTVASRRLAAHA